MNTKIMIATAVAALTLASPAFAGEGNGDPFAHYNAGFTAVVTPSARVASNGVATGFDNSVAPTVGSEGPVESANSLPRGFENGTAAYMQAQSVNRWFAEQADHRFAQRQASRPQS